MAALISLRRSPRSASPSAGSRSSDDCETTAPKVVAARSLVDVTALMHVDHLLVKSRAYPPPG